MDFDIPESTNCKEKIIHLSNERKKKCAEALKTAFFEFMKLETHKDETAIVQIKGDFNLLEKKFMNRKLIIKGYEYVGTTKDAIYYKCSVNTSGFSFDPNMYSPTSGFNRGSNQNPPTGFNFGNQWPFNKNRGIK